MTTLPTISASGFKDLFLKNAPLMDVRAPVEFADGAFPHTKNLPLMNDEERHEVGKRYKANGQDAAIALGTKLVSGELKAERIKAWTHFTQQHPNGALYCFRGGLRSRTTQNWLYEETGIEYPLIEGGYKALRRYLIDSLEQCIATLPMLVVGGRTGTGKTRVLNVCDRTIDLEGLANHRGSSFGATLTPQPTNIDFENILAVEYLRCVEHSLTQSVALEDEARMIGRVSLPKVLRDALSVAPIVLLEVSLEERVQNVLEDYVIALSQQYQQRDGDVDGLQTFYLHHKNSVERVKKRLGGDNLLKVLALLDSAYENLLNSGEVSGFEPYIEYLLNNYYDPMYDYQISFKQDRVRFKGDVNSVIDYIRKINE